MRRNFKIVFYMRGNYVNKEGKSAIMLRLSLDGKRITIGATGIAVTPSCGKCNNKGCVDAPRRPCR